MADEDYEHWPDDGQLQKLPAATAPGYDGHNGFCEHLYKAPGAPKAKDPAPVEPKTVVAPPYLHPLPFNPPQAVQWSPMQYMPQQPQQYNYNYGCYTPEMAPPGYYGNYVTYPPAAVSPAEEKKPEKKEKKTKASSPRAWQGRTKAEVDEDNMKFAAREGAYDERKIAPVGLAPDQIVWVVELDGGNTLRTFAEAQGLNGRWMADPRFKDSYYFVREAEKEEKKGKK